MCIFLQSDYEDCWDEKGVCKELTGVTTHWGGCFVLF